MLDASDLRSSRIPGASARSSLRSHGLECGWRHRTSVDVEANVRDRCRSESRASRVSIAPRFAFAPLEYIPTIRVVLQPASRMIAAHHFDRGCGGTHARLASELGASALDHERACLVGGAGVRAAGVARQGERGGAGDGHAGWRVQAGPRSGHGRAPGTVGEGGARLAGRKPVIRAGAWTSGRWNRHRPNPLPMRVFAATNTTSSVPQHRQVIRRGVAVP